MHHSFDKLTLNVNIPLSLVQTRRQALGITSDIRTQMEDSLSDMAGGNWRRLQENEAQILSVPGLVFV